jgi:hypothetical protein
MRADLYSRRRLRLGALLYQLQYYAVPDRVDDQGRIVLYRYDQERYVEVWGADVRLVRDDSIEILELEEAIARCKAALRGRPLHQPAE